MTRLDLVMDLAELAKANGWYVDTNSTYTLRFSRWVRGDDGNLIEPMTREELSVNIDPLGRVSGWASWRTVREHRDSKTGRRQRLVERLTQ